MGNERHTQMDRGRRDPSVGIVAWLGEGMARALARHAQLDVDAEKAGPDQTTSAWLRCCSAL